MRLKVTAVVLLLVIGCSIFAQETPAPKFGKGIFNLVGKDSSWTMKIGARAQILALGTWDVSNSEVSNAYSNFLVRRARLKFAGFALTPKLEYKIELGLSNRDIAGASIYTSNAPRYIYDAVIKWHFYKNFELWFGQTKLPGNRERVVSSGNLQFVDRSTLNALFNIDRDVGLQIRHQDNISNTFVIREILAISQGEGRNVTSGNIGGFQYTGRLEFLPFGEFKNNDDYVSSDLKRTETPKLALGVSYDFNNNAVKTRSNMGRYMVTDIGFHETNISTLFLDAMFKYKGFSILTEYANRHADNPIARNSDGTPTGLAVQVGNALNFQAGYLFKNNWELAGRFSEVNFDETVTGKGYSNEYTLGVSKYIVGHKLKVQSDITYRNNKYNPDLLTYRLQFEIHF